MHPAIAAVAAAARAGTAAPPTSGPPVARDDQAGVLAEIAAAGGPGAVLAAGRHLDVVASEPLVLALLNSDRPGVLLDKIERLNRFLHSHHRHRVLALEPDRIVVEHVSTGGAPPTALESLFVCGLYLELLRRIGASGLACSFPRSPAGAADVYRDGDPVDVPESGTGRWDIRWSAFAARRPLPGLDDVLLRDPPPDLTRHSVATTVAAVVRLDVSRRWRLRDVAAELTVSPRTLQRRLAAEQRSFTDVVRDVRLATARDLLRDPDRTVTDVGYVTGFADTAHFTRTFTQATGVSPSRWRRSERTGGDGPAGRP